MAIFATNARSAIWGPNLQQMQVLPCCCHVVAMFNPSYGVNFWVRCASGNVFLINSKKNMSMKDKFDLMLVPLVRLGLAKVRWGRRKKMRAGSAVITPLLDIDVSTLNVRSCEVKYVEGSIHSKTVYLVGAVWCDVCPIWPIHNASFWLTRGQLRWTSIL